METHPQLALAESVTSGLDQLRAQGRPGHARPPAGRSTPSMRGTEKPAMSASSTPTVKPLTARPAARLTDTDDLPTPPLPDEMASTRVRAGTAVFGAPFAAPSSGPGPSAPPSVGVPSRSSRLDGRDPGQGADPAGDLGLDLPAERAGRRRQCDSDQHAPSAAPRRRRPCRARRCCRRAQGRPRHAGHLATADLGGWGNGAHENMVRPVGRPRLELLQGGEPVPWYLP